MGNSEGGYGIMVTRQQVIDALKKRIPDLVADLEEDRVVGIIISHAFDHLDYPERQAIIRQTLRQSFQPEALVDVGPISALTPAEAEGLREAG
jgi:uncharacterized protein YuzE